MAQVIYTVVKGDKLSAIASKYRAQGYNVTWQSLAKLNNLPDANKIYIGQKIVISGEPIAETKTIGNKITGVTVNLQANSQRTLIARWDWSNTNTDHYLVRWWWGAAGQDGIPGVLDEQVSTAWRGSTYTAPEDAERVSFYVKPVAKTYKDSKGNDVPYFADAQWSDKVTHWFKDNPPVKPDVPTVTIKGTQLTATLENLQDLNADSIQFHVYQDNAHIVADETVKIVTYYVSHTFTIEPGHEYKVKARSKRGELYSDWTVYSSNLETAPAASSGITTCRANSSTSVYLKWEAVSNAETYDIEYSTKREYFDSSDQTTIQSGIRTPQYTKTGLESGHEYFFRVRAVNNQGESPWSDIVSLILGKKPAAPTTWSSTTTAISGELLKLYWVHNSEDGSKQKTAQLELTINGVTQPVIKIDNPTFDDEEAEEKTSTYSFDTSSYVEGTTLKWRVRTCGITEEYGDWSMQREIDIYGPPTLVLTMTTVDGSLLETLNSFPINVTAVAGPKTQKAIGYHLSVVANESYETVDHIGNRKIVGKNGQVYSRYFDINGDLSTTLSANDIDLANNISYTVTCTVTMDSGLTTEDSRTFTVTWEDMVCEPNAAIGIDKETYSASIRPYCIDIDENLVEGVTLSVYRREFDGRFTEIATGLPNTGGTYVTDPHPALDYARYRIVAISDDTGAVCYMDTGAIPVNGTSIIVQWDEDWQEFDSTNAADAEEHHWAGSMLKLPYNIDISPKYQPDVALVEYIGRQHPVSYYGTQRGQSETWNAVIPKSDVETLYAIRRLANWMGDVYVREPSGSGYWANITISFNRQHLDLTIPVTLDVKRVEGGI